MGLWQWLFGAPPAALDDEAFAARLPQWEAGQLRAACTTFRGDYPEPRLTAIRAELARREAEQGAGSRAASPSPAAADPGGGLDDLRLQLFRADYAPVRALDPERSLVRPLAPGLLQALVRDAGGLEVTLAREQARASGLDEPALFERARLQSLRAEGHLVHLEALGPLEVAVSDGFFLGACMLALLDSVEGPRGVVAAPVTWHHWVLHRVEPTTRPAVLDEVARLARRLLGDVEVRDAEVLGERVYWVRQGRPWEPIPFEPGPAGAPVARPPAELAALLAPA